jgi:hypothetical protein
VATAAVSKPGFSVAIGVSTVQAAVTASEGEGAALVLGAGEFSAEDIPAATVVAWMVERSASALEVA